MRLETVSELQQMGAADLQLLGHPHRGLSARHTAQDQYDHPTWIPQTSQCRPAESVKNSAACVTTVIDDRRTIPHVRGLIHRQAMASRTREAVWVQVPDQKGISIFVGDQVGNGGEHAG